jgi:hypothetical protein
MKKLGEVIYLKNKALNKDPRSNLFGFLKETNKKIK